MIKCMKTFEISHWMPIFFVVFKKQNKTIIVKNYAETLTPNFILHFT